MKYEDMKIGQMGYWEKSGQVFMKAEDGPFVIREATKNHPSSNWSKVGTLSYVSDDTELLEVNAVFSTLDRVIAIKGEVV